MTLSMGLMDEIQKRRVVRGSSSTAMTAAARPGEGGNSAQSTPIRRYTKPSERLTNLTKSDFGTFPSADSQRGVPSADSQRGVPNADSKSGVPKADSQNDVPNGDSQHGVPTADSQHDELSDGDGAAPDRKREPLALARPRFSLCLRRGKCIRARCGQRGGTRAGHKQ